MGQVQTGIKLNDQFSSVLLDFANGMMAATNAAVSFSNVMNQNISTNSLNNVQSEIQAVMNEMDALNQTAATPVSPTVTVDADHIGIPDIDARVIPHVEDGVQIDTPGNIDVPVNLVVTEQPEINIPDSVDVPVNPVVTEQPQIDVPGDIDVQQFNTRIEQMRSQLQRVSDIQQTINTQSQSVGVLPEDVAAGVQEVNTRLLQMQEALNQISQNPFDLPAETVEAEMASLQSRIREILQDQLELNETLSNMDIEIEQPPPVQIPVEWQTDNLEVFTNTGMDRFRQEAASANSMLQQLSDTQHEIAGQAASTNVLPSSAARDMAALAARIDNVRERIQQIENNPLSMGTGRANRELEQLRSQLGQAIQQQNDLNSAIGRMDVREANAAYLRLSQTIGSAEAHIRDNVSEQRVFNEAINGGTNNAKSLVRTLMGLSVVQSVVGMVKGQIDSAIGRMDTMTNYNRTMTAITGSSEMASASLEKLKEITNGTAYGLDAAAKGVQNFVTRGMAIGNATNEVSNWADAVAFYGDGTNETLLNVNDALGQMLSKGTVEMDQLNRLTDAGINAVGMYAQATGRAVSDVQADLSKGKISSLEFITTVSSAFENGTNGVLNISGAAKEAGATWATTIANATAAVTRGIIAMIDGINKGLSNAGFGTILDGIKEFGVQAEKVLSKIGTFIGSVITKITPLTNIVVETFSYITNNVNLSLDSVLTGIANFVGIVVKLLEPILSLVSKIATFIVDNWSIISPVIYGVAAALAVFYGWQLLVNTVSTISKGIKIGLCIASYAHAAATGAEVAATAAATAAQYGLNTAMYACPLVWIIILIIALIAMVYMAVAAINKFAGTSISATGIICGAFMVALAFIGNILVALWNLVVDVFVLIYNLVATVANFIGNVFDDPVGSICRLFFGLADTILGILQALASAIDTIFGSNLASAVQGWRNSLSGWVDDTFGRGKEIMKKVDSETLHLDRFEYSDAWDAGYGFGEGIDDRISNLFEIPDIPTPEDLGIDAITESNNQAANIATAKNTGDTAKAAQKAAQSLDITGENLKYIKEMAERDYINRFTTARINIKQTNHNTVKNNMDLDGINEYLRSDLEQRMAATAEGVH